MQALQRKMAIFLLTALLIGFSACIPQTEQKVPENDEYAAQTIQIEGIEVLSGAIAEVSVAELRALPQHDLAASYKRTTGLFEEFAMQGPTLADVITLAGGDIGDYEGIGVIGRDNYYCLISKEVIELTPANELLVALNIDGAAELAELDAPARLAVQGQFGPYWVRQIGKIILYKEIPQKIITSVWVFDKLTEGIEPYEYEYYGSKDNAVDLEQVFSRLDSVDMRAFFTMKSSDGFLKNEAMNMVKSRYYIKVDGADAPTNVSPYIKLGMNVQHIAWFSTNADAAFFPAELLKFMPSAEMGGKQGIPLDELLFEVGVERVRGQNFDILGASGENITLAGTDMQRAMLVYEGGVAGVIFDEALGFDALPALTRVRVSAHEPTPYGTEKAPEPPQPEAPSQPNTPETPAQPEIPAQPTADTFGRTAEGKDVALTIGGDGVGRVYTLSMEEIKSIGEESLVFSVVNNWPTRKIAVAKGVDLLALLKKCGLSEAAAVVRFEAQDGYKTSITMAQLNETRYAYPAVASLSTEGKYAVAPMLSYAYEAGTSNPANAKADTLRLCIGQRGLNDVNTAVAVQSVTRITVSKVGPGKWDAPDIIREGNTVRFEHDTMDSVKIYYTLDGSEPTEQSLIYNPSTTYFQPDLIKPFEADTGATVRARVFGYGKHPSDVAASEGAG